MMGLGIEDILKDKRETIKRIAEKYGARNVRVFGSVARGEASSISDLDFIVSMEKGRSYLDLVGLWQELEELLGSHVDVITDGGISPYLKEAVLKEAVPL
jgi:predicted nucleotidyltransferase